MSSVNPSLLISPSNNSIPFITTPFVFTTAQLRIDSVLQNGMLVKSVRITNLDNINNLTYRTQSPSGALKIIPVSSVDTFDEWGSYIEINPNAVTGDGLLEVDMVLQQDAIQERPKTLSRTLERVGQLG